MLVLLILNCINIMVVIYSVVYEVVQSKINKRLQHILSIMKLKHKLLSVEHYEQISGMDFHTYNIIRLIRYNRELKAIEKAMVV